MNQLVEIYIYILLSDSAQTEMEDQHGYFKNMIKKNKEKSVISFYFFLSF